MSAGLRIGLSTTTAEPALTGGRLDGIGVYSRAMYSMASLLTA